MELEFVEQPLVVQLIVDGKLWKEVHRKRYQKYLSKLRAASSFQDLEQLCLECDRAIARLLAYRWLAMRAWMSEEFAKKLISYHIDPQVVKDVVSECQTLGYLNDEREGALYIARRKKEGWGPQRIRYRGGQKSAQLQEMVAPLFTEEEEREAIVRWVHKKSPPGGWTKVQEKGKLYRFLIGKGFTPSLVRKQLLVDD